MEVKVYNQEGKESGKLKLPEEIFSIPWNSNLVHKVTVSMMSNKRAGTAHVKDRGDVRGGGKKPWRQKGTGRARHGSRRSPIWVGGGVTHGPSKDKNYSKKINKKEKIKALYTVLSRKLKDGEIVFVDSLSFGEPKTKEAKKVFNALGKVPGFEGMPKKKKNSALIALNKKNTNTEKSFRNFNNIKLDEARNLNPLTLLQYKYLVVTGPEEVFKQLSKVK